MMIEKEDQFVCKVCNKAFSCGKAVGGHMRSHKPEKQDQRPRRGSSNVDDTTCKLCGRVFRSMKSLFGHMRYHPERQWRGMNPPSATAQRGLHICGKQIKVEEADDLVSPAVEGLLMLARGGEEDSEENGKYVDDDSIGHELSDMSVRDDDQLEKKMISCSDKKKAVTGKRKRETLEAGNDSKLQRSLCGHKKYKSNRGDDKEEVGVEKKEHVKSEKEEVDKLEEAMLGLHRCLVCYKTFPTEQALGGHLRCHRVVSSPTLGSTCASAEEAASGRRVADFDLNELPQDVEDGGAVDIAFHGA